MPDFAFEFISKAVILFFFNDGMFWLKNGEPNKTIITRPQAGTGQEREMFMLVKIMRKDFSLSDGN